MAGAGKHRARKERKNGNNGNGNGKNSPASPETQESPSSNSPTQHQSPPTRYDGGADPSAARPAINPSNNGNSNGVVAVRAHRNLDLGIMNSYLQNGQQVPENTPKRPTAINPTGQAIQVRLNHFPVENLPTKPIYQYDVTIGGGNEKRGLNKKAFQSRTVNQALGEDWIYDGNKIAYWYKDLGNQEKIINVDFDEEAGREPRTGKDGKPRRDVTKVVIKKAKTVRMDSLDAYLRGQLRVWDNNCLEAITFLDHLLREQPSQNFTIQKRNFFRRGQTRSLLGGGIEAMKGVYASMRPVSSGIAPSKTPGRLSINVDVANTTFWASQFLHLAARDLVGAQDVNYLVQTLRPTNRDDNESHDFKLLRRLKRVGVECRHRPGSENNPDTYVVDKFILKNAQQQSLPFRDPNTGQESKLTVEQYFRRKYNKQLSFPQLPLVKMTKGVSTYLPMELCRIQENQRYGFKLSDRQTTEMIKFAVTLPNQRWQDIQNGLSMFNWGADRYLHKYGLKVLDNGSKPAQIAAKLLPPPKVGFGQGEAVPQYSGRWDLRGKRFIETNSAPLQSWGVCLVPGRIKVDPGGAKSFIQNLVRIYEGHGGRVQRKDPVIVNGVADAAKCVEMLWTAAGNQSRAPPQLLVFIVPSKDSGFYSRIKKSADCRYGVVSQVLQAAHVQKNQAQYCSNVAMKVNAKLGGATSRALGLRGNEGWITKPTMYVGADVSHAAPGVEGASIAAITVSFDRRGLKYAGLVESNGIRVEMITTENWENVFGLLCERWIQTLGNGKAPQHLIYFRDGVSEGQYAQVIEQEVRDIRSVLHNKDPTTPTKITCLTCTKRHHVRFFPQKGDRNGNPQPGTLVQDGCTAPFEYDFYLCAHSAIKGTARPVHYFVLKDEANLKQEELQNMIYEASYQYVRSTTPVSLFPAIYYAHLAAARGTCHVNQPSRSSGPEDQTKTGSSGKEQTEIPKLLDMPNSRGIKGVMWYV